jgi:ditrans,polycis-polyprenyl diphosphate synthase
MVEYFINNRSRTIVNLYLAYTSCDEITTALQNCVKDALTQDVNPDTYAYLSLLFTS